ILARPMTSPSAAVDQGKADERRLSTARKQASEDPKNPQWPYEVATILESQGNEAGAVEQYKAALAIDPGYPPALQRFASTLIMTKKYDEARKVLVDGIAAEKDAIARLNKSRAKDEPELAPNPEFQVLLFDADMALGASRSAEAREALRTLLRINPTVFPRMVQGWAFNVAFQQNDKKMALAGIQVAIEEAGAGHEQAAATELENLKKTVTTINFNAGRADLWGSRGHRVWGAWCGTRSRGSIGSRFERCNSHALRSRPCVSDSRALPACSAFFTPQGSGWCSVEACSQARLPGAHVSSEIRLAGVGALRSSRRPMPLHSL
ncbi:MAG: hypothetical protein EB084_00945, partial [Proteobacteria bacterium]|nr:hypothetical protein [Pseudomonadota bacterium]